MKREVAKSEKYSGAQTGVSLQLPKKFVPRIAYMAAMMKRRKKALLTGTTAFDTAVISRLRLLRVLKSFTARPRRRRRRSLALGSSPPLADTIRLHTYEEEDTCMSYEEEDTCMSYEEEDTCTSYEEEDTCMSYDDVAYRNGHDEEVKPVGSLGVKRLKTVVAVCKDVEHQLCRKK